MKRKYVKAVGRIFYMSLYTLIFLCIINTYIYYPLITYENYRKYFIYCTIHSLSMCSNCIDFICRMHPYVFRVAKEREYPFFDVDYDLDINQEQGICYDCDGKWNRIIPYDPCNTLLDQEEITKSQILDLFFNN